MQKLAVLIDADNTSYKHIEWILKEIEHYGIATIKRIYGDWSAENLKSWSQTLLKFNIKPIQQFSYVSNKNMTDTRLIIDTMDLLYQEQLDGFCIVSSDCDYIPLISRLRENGLSVYGFGNRAKVNPVILDGYTKFIYIGDIIPSNNTSQSIISVEQSTINKQDQQLTTDTPVTTKNLKEIKKLILSIIQDCKRTSDGWVNLSSIGMKLKSKDYGFSTLIKLFEAIGSFEIKSSINQKFIREKNYLITDNNGVIKQQLVEDTIQKCNIKNNWVSFGELGKHIDYKKFGYSSLLKFMQSIDGIHIKKLNTQHYVEVNLKDLGVASDLKEIVNNAIEQAPKEHDNWCYLGHLSQYIDYKKLGFSKLKKLLISLDCLEFKERENKTFVRMK